MSELYERIDELCRQRGISGAKMAGDLGLSRSSLSELRSGRSQSFRMETMRKIAQYFNVTVDQLLNNAPTASITSEPQAVSDSQFATFVGKIHERGMDMGEFDEDDFEDIADFMKLLKRKKDR